MHSLIKVLLLISAFLLQPEPSRAAEDIFEVVDAELVDRAVTLKAPEGARRIRLRVRTADGEWETCTLAHLSGREGFLKLRLPDGVEEADIEVAASFTDPFPFEFYEGQTEFDPEQGDGGAARLSPGDAELTAFVADGQEGETVEESDIWKWRGDTLYFFNQYRGLQVIDVADPASPKRLASMRVASSGEQLYLHPEADFAILLAYNYSTGTGEALLVEHTAENELIERAAIRVPGYILESRMVGNILYIVSRNAWQESIVDPDTGIEHISWKSGLSILKVDLANPAEPIVSDPLDLQNDQYDYWGGQVQATSDALMIATSAYDSQLRQSVSAVHVIDISDPMEEPSLAFQAPVKGQVLNKFNLHLRDDILTVVSQVWRWTENRQRYASVETFDLTQPSGQRAEALASMELANNETITASRFSGDLLYLVTVLRVDPLFVISVADPADPQLLGELKVPGFSTHLEVWDDSLISVGVEDSRIAISWFDVSNPSNPTLASRVYVGDEEGWSWSEANWDEKAFGFFPNDGWILLPYQGYDSGKGWSSGVQLIQMGEKELLKRGSIEHEFQARRARVLEGAVVSISGQSLKSLDISDPDEPRLLSELTLAWPADFVHRVGEYLVQLERGPSYWWGSQSQESGKLHVSPVDDPDALIFSLELEDGRIAGSYLTDDCLVIAQERFLEPNEGDEVQHPVTRFANTIIDVSDPANPSVSGIDTFDIENDGWYGYGSDYRAGLLSLGALLWYPGELNFYFFAEPGIGGARTDAFFPYYPSSGRAITVSIEDKTQPLILASTSLAGDQDEDRADSNRWPEGGMKLLNDFLYFGLLESSYEETPEQGGRWLARHRLGQLDLSNPAFPRNLDLVEIPGTFESMLASESGGRILFTSSHRSYNTGNSWTRESLIQASAFDGIKAYLLDEIDLGDRGYGPKIFKDEYIVIGYTDYSSGGSISELTFYEWLETGSFLERNKLQQSGAIYRMGIVDQLLFAPGTGSMNVIDFSDPGDPELNVVAFPNRNFWQRIDLIDVYERQFAYLPLGWQGVDTLDFDVAFEALAASSERSGDGLRDNWALVASQDGSEASTIIDLDSLSKTSALGNLILSSLEESRDWSFSDASEKIGYSDWISDVLELGEGEEIPSGDADTDGDGLSNAWEFVSGTDPNDASSRRRLKTGFTYDELGNGYLYLRLEFNLQALDVWDALPQVSPDLENWTDHSEGFQILEEEFSSVRLFRMQEPLNASNPLFVRLRVSTDN